MLPHMAFFFFFFDGTVAELSQFSIYAVDSMWMESDGQKN